MVKGEHHDTLGCFFLNHPPISEFQVAVVGEHPITRGLPDSFTVQDELYMIELQDPDASRTLLTTELAADPSPPGFGFVYDEDTSLQSDGKTRVLGYARDVGRGEIVYVGLGVIATPAAPPTRLPWIQALMRIARCRLNSTACGKVKRLAACWKTV